jgi:hypothetical protein
MPTACAARSPQAVDNCRIRTSDRDPLIYGGVMRDGFWYLRIAYDHDVETEHLKAFEQAMASWNEHKETTRVIFQWATDAQIDLRLQRGASIHVKQEDIHSDLLAIDEARIERDESTKCAEYVSSGPYIWYSLKMKAPEFLDMARIYTHELGHVLNIRHKPGTSVMHEGNDDSCEKQAASIASIQPDDAWDAGRCAWGARKKLQVPGATHRPYVPPTR